MIDYLKDKSGVQIIVPQKADEIIITYKTPVSVDLKQVTMPPPILKKVLADVGLVYIVKDNVIQVTTPKSPAKP